MSFDISTEQRGAGAVVIAVTGDLDPYTAPDLKTNLHAAIDEGAVRVVIDMNETLFIDSTSLGVLVGGLKRLKPAGGELSIVCQDRSISRIFEITGLDRVFPLHTSVESALDAVHGPVAS